jgi:sensor c-di-GMP phosphodiesterase-like protein
VVAEGVETERQASELRKLGCELAQGFLFHRPVDAKGIRPLLAAGQASAARRRREPTTHGAAREGGVVNAPARGR